MLDQLFKMLGGEHPGVVARFTTKCSDKQWQLLDVHRDRVLVLSAGPEVLAMDGQVTGWAPSDVDIELAWATPICLSVMRHDLSPVSWIQRSGQNLRAKPPFKREMRGLVTQLPPRDPEVRSQRDYANWPT